MQIHNVYSDIGFFLSHVLNSILNGKIKKFKYNLGNASFVLKYDPNYELPTAIIDFIGVNPFNIRMNTFHKVLTNNTYLVDVLYNRTKDIVLSMQEDLYYIDYNVNINCESQLHAIELKHNLENFLPVGKLLNYLSFCSFYEIDEIFLNKYIFDVNNDDIDNIFLTHNKIADRMVYCFSTEYRPLIRLESIDLSIQDITAATFTVTCSFKILTHLPSKLVFNKSLLLNYNKIHLIRHDNIRFPINTNYDFYLLNNEKLIYFDKISNENSEFEIFKSPTYIEKGEYNSIFFDQHVHDLLEIHTFSNGSKTVKLKFDGKYKILKNVEFLQNNKIKALIEIEKMEEIYIVYSINKIIRNIDIKSKLDNYNVKFERPIVPNQVFSIINNINRYRVELNYEETSINGYNDLLLQIPVKLNKLGEFTLAHNNIIINGKIDLKTGEFDLFNILNSDLTINNTLSLLFLNVDFVFTVFEIRGTGYIEEIKLDIMSTFSNSISTVSVIANDNINYFKNVKNILVDKIELIQNENNEVTFSIFNNVNIVDNSDFSFYFTKKNLLISSKTNYIIFKEFYNNKLIFKSSSKFYFDHLDEINNVYPLILKIGL